MGWVFIYWDDLQLGPTYPEDEDEDEDEVNSQEENGS